MKKLLLSTAIAFMALTTTAQTRTNTAQLKFEAQTLKVTKAIGWKQNDATGKWVKNKNVIDDKYCDSYWVAHRSQNFTWMQFKTVTYNNQTYYVFLYESHSGSYRYPSIHEGWSTHLTTRFFIITAEEYAKIKNEVQLKTGKNVIISATLSSSIKSAYSGLGGEHLYNQKNLLAKITKEFTDGSKYSRNFSFVFNSQFVDGKHVVRFLLPPTYISSYSYDNKPAKNPLEKQYFEIETEEFYKLLSIASNTSTPTDTTTTQPVDETVKELIKEPIENTIDMGAKGKEDAKQHYKSRNTGAIGTAVTTILLSPFIGWIPPAICAKKTPNNHNLDYPDTKLMENYEYNYSYKKTAHRKKRIVLWGTFGISSGAWILLAAVL